MIEKGPLQEFDVSLEMAESLMSIERDTFSNPPRQEHQKSVEGLRGGAAILMVAGFERFLRRLMEYHLAPFARTSPSFDFNKLPEKMIVHSVFTSIEHSLKGKPHNPKKNKIDRIPDIERACRIIISQTLSPEAFSDTGSNPNSKTVKQMFSSIGIQDVFNKIKSNFESKWNQAVASKFIQDKLDEIVNRRHVVAHMADALNISRSELNTSVRFLKILSKLLNNEIEAHMTQIREAAFN